MPVPTVVPWSRANLDEAVQALVVVAPATELRKGVSTVEKWATGDILAIIKGSPAVERDVATALHSAGALAEVDAAAFSAPVVLPPTPTTRKGQAVVLSPMPPMEDDYIDVRAVADAASAGVRRAVAALGSRISTPVHIGLVLHHSIRRLGLFHDSVVRPDTRGPDFSNAMEVAVAGALEGLWAPLQTREAAGDDTAVEPVELLRFGWVTDEGLQPQDDAVGSAIARRARAVELGRRLARDLGGADPERGAAPRLVERLREEFAELPVSMRVEDDPDVVRTEYPLAHAVARASIPVERHRPRIVRLEYTGDGAAEDLQHIFIAGKGITYDTGGADIKAGGIMAGMKRDKCGAAAGAGFVRAIAELRPANLRVVAYLGFVRNSVGAESYVADEIITSHAGVRVLVVNTDAEGRMVLADCLSHIREEAAGIDDAQHAGIQIYSIATLTGHAALAMGPYSVVLPNGVSRKFRDDERLQAAGHRVGDPFELSTLRREDIAFVAPSPASRGDYDVKQCNNAASSKTKRGHQFPAAFLLKASGLDRHGSFSDKPLSWCHLDIAGAAANGPVGAGIETGAPIAGLVSLHLSDVDADVVDADGAAAGAGSA